MMEKRGAWKRLTLYWYSGPCRGDEPEFGIIGTVSASVAGQKCHAVDQGVGADKKVG